MIARESDTVAHQRTADALCGNPTIVSELSASIGASVSSVYDYLQHAARTAHGEGGEQFPVAPPEYKHCGFIAFGNPVNYSS